MFHVHVLVALGLVGSVPSLGDEERAPGFERAAVEARSIVCEGLVLDSDGAAVQGAVVVSSAGGKAVSDASGRYRLAVEVQEGTRELRITAVGGPSGNLAATASITLSHRSGAEWVPPLELAQGSACQASWLPLLTTQPGVNDEIHALAAFDDGTGPALFAGGIFQNAGGVRVRFLAKWNGLSWVDVPGDLTGGVLTLAVFDDGHGPALYAGGHFNQAGGALAPHIARWDGSSWSGLGSGTNDVVVTLEVFEGELYAGGTFTSAGEEPAQFIARWNGSTWKRAGGGTSNTVSDLKVFDDGTGPALYAGGSFLAAGGAPASRIARWKGGTWSPLGTGVSGGIADLEVFDDGGGPALYVGGGFDTAGGLPAGNVARWDGTSWSAVGAGTDGDVFALAVHDDGGGTALFAAGDFATAGGVPASGIARWDGNVWSGIGAVEGVFERILDLASFDDGSGPALYAGGSFLSISGIQASCIARWDGSSWSGVEAGINALGGGGELVIHALTVFDDGSGPALYAGGDFLTAGGVTVNRIARWNGSSWSALGSGVNGVVHVLAGHDDGNGPALYAGGEFGMAGGVPARRIARWNGSSWSALGSGMTAGFVRALATFDEGNGPVLFAGGSFTQAGGVSSLRLARWNGSSWTAVGNNGLGFLSVEVRALLVHDDGSGPALFVGGIFDMAGGQNAHDLAKWTGSSWSTVGGWSGSVFSLAEFDDGSGLALYAGGGFVSGGSISARHVAKWNGSSWSTLGNGLSSSVLSLTSFDDGSGPALYAGGRFRELQLAMTGIARWDGRAWSALGSGMSLNPASKTPATEALVVFNDRTGPALHVGGDFFSVPDSLDSLLAKWGCPDTTAPVIACPQPLVVGDFDGDPGERVSFVVTATDAEDYAPALVCVPPSGSFFPRGTTLVTCTATDFSGNQNTCQFPVTVRAQMRELSPSRFQ